MNRHLITAGLLVAFAAGSFFYIRGSERAKIENQNINNTLEGIRDGRAIENETRGSSDDALRDDLLGRVRPPDGK